MSTMEKRKPQMEKHKDAALVTCLCIFTTNLLAESTNLLSDFLWARCLGIAQQDSLFSVSPSCNQVLLWDRVCVEVGLRQNTLPAHTVLAESTSLHLLSLINGSSVSHNQWGKDRERERRTEQEVLRGLKQHLAVLIRKNSLKCWTRDPHTNRENSTPYFHKKGWAISQGGGGRVLPRERILLLQTPSVGQKGLQCWHLTNSFLILLLKSKPRGRELAARGTCAVWENVFCKRLLHIQITKMVRLYIV